MFKRYNVKKRFINLTVGFVIVNLFGWLLCTGESYPVPKPDHFTHYTTRSAYP